ncbi:MAG TPA: ERF superfamily [Lachnospiraceae bacterium]|nr:ERF superfamily [Lachnospiraceae bacterium]
MGKYSYLNLNQKMIKIRKKIPALIRKRYSEDVDYDFVKLDDINQFLTPALNRYGVDFDILREIPTQKDASGNTVFLIQDGNLWRYEADLEICWTNADHPDERSLSVVHLVGTNDVADKAKGTAMTYGLKYYLLNKFNIPQNGDEDPDMKGMKPEKEPQKERAAAEKKVANKKQDTTGVREIAIAGYMPQGSLDEGLGDIPAHAGSGNAGDRAIRSGNAISTAKTGETPNKDKGNPQIQQMKDYKEAAAALKEKSDEEKAGRENKHPKETESGKQPVHSASDGQRDESVSPEKQMGKELKRAEREVSQSMDEPEEDDFDFSDEDVSEEESRAEEKAAGDGFRGVTEEDEIPFSGDEEETQEDEAESEDDKVEKAKAVVCNFGYFQGRTLGEMLETPKGWESLKWIVTRYKGANTQMKEAATILVEADAYMPKAA